MDPDSQSSRPFFTQQALATARRAYLKPHTVAAEDVTEAQRSLSARETTSASSDVHAILKQQHLRYRRGLSAESASDAR